MGIPLGPSALFFLGLFIALVIITCVIVLLIDKRVKYSAPLILARLAFNKGEKKAFYSAFILSLKVSVITLSGFFKGGNLGIGFGFLLCSLPYLANLYTFYREITES